MSEWDYIIVGAGSAGCVLADRLSVNSAHRVLLLEAGPDDTSPFIHMPVGAAKLYGDPRHAWYFQTQAHGDVPSEFWLRGKMLGGSSAINGMMYFRGQPEDYDGWEALGAKGWGWSEMGRVFKAIESHELGGNEDRGAGGPLSITVNPERNKLTEAFITAGEQMGLRRVEDLNSSKQGGVGYTIRTIYKGRRQSAAQAFLKPARQRRNLRVETNVVVNKVLFEGKRAVGVELRRADGTQTVYRAQGEVILSAGALISPQILQRSGVGSGKFLGNLGVDVIADSPGVGKHMLEHRLLMMRFGLTEPLSQNPQFRGLRLIGNVLRYYLTHKGPMAGGYGSVGAFVRVMPDALTPDVEVLLAPLANDIDAKGNIKPDSTHSIQVFGYPLRSRSEGWVAIASANPQDPANIYAGYLTDPYDVAVSVAMHRYLRRWMQQPAIAPLLDYEREPTRSLQTDDEILRGFRQLGAAGYHACGTCRMGDFPDAVLDEKLRVKGVDGLRVVDGSIMPAMVSANTNAPIMASAWRASELILQGRNH